MIQIIGVIFIILSMCNIDAVENLCDFKGAYNRSQGRTQVKYAMEYLVGKGAYESTKYILHRLGPFKLPYELVAKLAAETATVLACHTEKKMEKIGSLCAWEIEKGLFRVCCKNQSWYRALERSSVVGSHIAQCFMNTVGKGLNYIIIASIRSNLENSKKRRNSSSLYIAIPLVDFNST